MEDKLDKLMSLIEGSEKRMAEEMQAIKLAVDTIRPDITTAAPALGVGGPSSGPGSSATSGASPAVPDAKLVFAIDTTSLGAPLPTRCSTEGPSCGAIESRPPFAPATAPTSPMAIVDVVPKLVATAASAIGDAASLRATRSSECPSSDTSALVTLEAIPLTATTPLDVTATEQLKPFSVIDLSVLAPSRYSACLINGVVDNTKLDDVVSLERVEVVAFAMVGIIYVDPGDHRQPPWPPPLICTIWLLCWEVSTCSQAELKPWPGEAQYQYTGVLHPWPPLCENSSLHKLQEILGISRMLQLHGNLLAPFCFLMSKDQFNASVMWCCKNLLWTVKEWALDIHWMLQAGVISYAPPWHEQPASHLLLQVLVNSSVLALFYSYSPCSFNLQVTSCLFTNDKRAPEKLRSAARYSTKSTMESLHILVRWSSMRKSFQISGVLNHWSWWWLNTWSPIVLLVYTHWLQQEHVFMGLEVFDMQLLGWSYIAVFSKCNTLVSECVFTKFQKLHLYQCLPSQFTAYHLRDNPMELFAVHVASTRCKGTDFQCIHIGRPNYLTYFAHCCDAFSSSFPFIGDTFCMYTCMWTANSRGSGEMIRHLVGHLLGECFLNIIYCSDKSSIEHYQISKAGLRVATTVNFWVPLVLVDNTNPYPGGCTLALCSCEKCWTISEPTALHSSDQLRWLSVLHAYASRIWLITWAENDLELSSGYGQAPSQEGRNVTNQAVVSDSVHVGHYYYIAFVNKIAIGYNYCSNQDYSFDTIYSDLIYYHEDYHCNASNIKEVHAPWDPGKSALGSPPKTSAWGQAEFQEGRNVMVLNNSLLSFQNYKLAFRRHLLGASRFSRTGECHGPCIICIKAEPSSTPATGRGASQVLSGA